MENVKFEMSNEELDLIIKDRIMKLVDKDFDNLVHKRAIELLDTMITWELGEPGSRSGYGVHGNVGLLVGEYVKERVNKALDARDFLSKENLEKIEKDIAHDIASELRTRIIESIGRYLSPLDDDENEDEMY